MFTVYHSNQLDLLKTLTSALIARDPLADPFQQEVVLVQSPGMAQWLQMQLAEQFGIAANVAFPLPATFIWDMFTRVLPDIPKESAFSKDAMTEADVVVAGDADPAGVCATAALSDR